MPPRQRFVEPFVGVQQGPPSILARFLRILFPSLLPSLWTMPIPLAWTDGKRKEQWPFLHFEPPLRASAGSPSSPHSQPHGPFVAGGVSWRLKLYPLLRGRWTLSRSTIYIGVLHPLPHMHNHNLELGGTMNKGHLPPHTGKASTALLRRFDIVNKGERRSFHHSVLRSTFIRNSVDVRVLRRENGTTGLLNRRINKLAMQLLAAATY